MPGYNQSVPMTDHNLPGTQQSAKWRSGFPTIATSGATFVRGTQWGLYNGTLAVAALKGSRVLFIRFDAAGNFSYVKVPRACGGTAGCARSRPRATATCWSPRPTAVRGTTCCASTRAADGRGGQPPQPRLRVPRAIVGSQTAKASTGSHGTRPGAARTNGPRSRTGPPTGTGTARSPTRGRRWPCRGTETSHKPCRRAHDPHGETFDRATRTYGTPVSAGRPIDGVSPRPGRRSTSGRCPTPRCAP